MPLSLAQYVDTQCGHTGQSPALGVWLSSATNTTSQTIDVPYNTKSVNLKLNNFSVVCYSNNAVQEVRWLNSVHSTSPPATITGGSFGTAFSTNFGASYQSIGNFKWATREFTYAPQGGFTQSGTYTITFKSTGINRFTSGSYGCHSGGNVSGWNYSGCGATYPSLSIRINVERPHGSCQVLDAPGNISVDEDFNARFRVTNGGGVPGNETWTVDPSIAQRFVLDRYGVSPNFGRSRINIKPNTSGAFGQILGSNQTTTTDSLSFTAPSTQGNYDFWWRIIKAGDFATNITCSTPIRVGPPSYIHRTDFENVPDSRVEPGERVSVDVSAWNVGRVVGSNDAGMLVKNVNSSRTNSEQWNRISNSQYRGNNALLGEGLYLNNQGFCNESGADPPNTTDCWFWAVKDLPINNTDQARSNFEFTVNSNAQHGEDICFEIYIRPESNGNGFYKADELCFTVYKPRKPIVKVTGGDTRVGATVNLSADGTCQLESGISGKIEADNGTASGSSGQYAVSAVGTIGGFASNTGNSTGGLDDLKFNNDGSYGGYDVFCRRDFYDRFQANATDLPQASLSTSSLPNASQGSIFKHDGNLLIQRTDLPLNRDLTILVDGDVVISDDITYPSIYPSRNNIPSLAVHATGQIAVVSGVDRIDGMYTTNSEFSTCGSVSDSITSACNNPLTVNGIVIANKLHLRRIGGDISGAPAEIFRFLPELYLNPPAGNEYEINLIKENYLDLPPVF